MHNPATPVNTATAVGDALRAAAALVDRLPGDLPKPYVASGVSEVVNISWYLDISTRSVAAQLITAGEICQAVGGAWTTEDVREGRYQVTRRSQVRPGLQLNVYTLIGGDGA